ncbi:MAG: hypothetical protein RR847_00610 [Bacilli bacterium]
MSYIYDVLLNYNKYFFDFYEWNLGDDIYHIRKIPFFKVRTKVLVDIVNNDVKIDKKLLDNFFDKTEIFTKNAVKTIDYACLFSDYKKVIGVKFNCDGEVIGKSSLLFLEEDEVIKACKGLKITDISYVNLNLHSSLFKTRKEIKMQSFIENKIKMETNFEKLKYLYFDCFGKSEDNINKIVADINQEIVFNWDNIYLKLYNFLKLTSVNK